MIRKSTIAKMSALFLGMMSFVGRGQAQICAATNSLSCTSGDYFSGVTFKNSAGTTFSVSGLNCANTGGSNKLMTNGAVMDLTPGEVISMTIDNTCVFAENAGVWIDMDGDNNFTAAECISGPSGPFGSIASNTSKTCSLKLPCVSVTAGKRIMRVRCMYSSFSAGQGCGTVSNYGNILDFEVNIKAVSPPVADFTVPTGPNFVKAPITFNSTSTNASYTQTWTFYGGATPIPGFTTGPKGKASWPAIGFYNVKLRQDFCGYSDSVTKVVKIENPTQAPVADFISNTNQVEIWYNVQMNDLSTNGPTSWSWTCTSPDGLTILNSTAQNPSFMLTQLGWWDVCLTSTNGIGPSTKKCKAKYVQCTPPGEFFMGPNKIAVNQNGIIYDNGGKTGNYGDNRKTSIDYFKIFPCGAKEIRLSFSQIKLAVGDAGDRLRIYDGQDAGGKELTPTGGITGVNQAYFRTYTFKATSGAIYMTFESNGSGNDSGFIGNWDSDLLPVTNPKSGFTTQYDTVGVGTLVTYNSNVTKAQGQVSYDWMIDGNDNMGNMQNFQNAFISDGRYQVCLIASVCNGIDTFCKNTTVIIPSDPVKLNFVVDNQRPNVGQMVNFTTSTNTASNFEWSIYPATFSYVGGTTMNSRNPQIIFSAGGAYTFTLRAWNAVGTRAATETKVIKTKYVIAVKYCTPVTDMLSGDVAISKVQLFQDSTNILENPSPAGLESFHDYTSQFNNYLSFGSYYTIAVTRRTNSNQANYKAWIDYNIDGVFTDDELVLNSGAISTTVTSNKFKVPDLANCFEGITRMRVAVAYGAFSNTSCGVNQVGEYEDYGITLKNDGIAPVITLLGDQTVRVEKASSASACWTEIAKTTYVAKDQTEGDMTAKVIMDSDLDCTIPGTYYINFNVKDAAGNKAITATRKVVVVLDKTPPVLTLLGKDTVVVEQCDNTTIPSAVATDNTDGNLTSNIVVKGTYDASTVGSYKINYSVTDAQGNLAQKTRVVNVVDTKKPGIFSYGKRIIDGQKVQVQIGSLFVDDVSAYDTCNGSTDINKVPGYNGLVNTLKRATYPMTYFATDIHGNKAVENGFTVLYVVDDYIAPEIVLNTADTVIHDVNNTYSSQSVSVYDNYYLSNKISVVKTGKVNPFKLGLYVETFVATDESGNSATRNRYVKVVDRIAPTIITSAVNVCAGTPFWAFSDLTVEDNYYSNDELFPLVTVHDNDVNVYVAGVYHINYQVIDPSGNKSAVVMRPVFVQYEPNCFNSFASTKDLSLDKRFVISPNPTSGMVKLSYALTNNEPVQVNVMNMLGSEIASFKMNGGMGNESFDFSKYANGTYLIKISNNGQSFTSKVIVNH